MSRTNLVASVAGQTGAVTLAQSDLIDNDLISTDQQTFGRRLATTTAALTSGRCYFSYFTAKQSATYANIRAAVATAAGATPTLARMGVYTVDGSGNLTLLAACASDTTLFATTFTAYTRALTANAALVRGTRYAFGLIVVSAASMPAVYCSQTLVATEWAKSPRLASYVSGQSDLPSSLAVGSLTDSNIGLYGALAP